MLRTRLKKMVQPFQGLQAKACITLTAVVVLTAVTIGTTVWRRARSQMVDVAADQTLNTARLIATAAYQPYESQDRERLVGLCQHLVADRQLLYIAFISPEAKVIAAAQKPHTLLELLNESGQAMNTVLRAGVHIRPFADNVAAMEAVVPITGPDATAPGVSIGTLLLASDLHPLQEQLAAMARRVIEMTSAIAVAVIVLGGLAMRQLVGPINKLAQASLDLAYKHDYHRIESTRTDELGRLTDAFNHMAGRLLKTQRDLLELNTELETRVALRTVELETRNEQLRRIAGKDPLTGLYNRRSFSELLNRDMAEAQRYGREIACMMIDVDNFKQVNDVHGHPAGDRVLRQVAEIISKEVRQCDITARFGGDEFVVLLPQCTATEAFHLAKRIREQTRLAMREWDKGPVRISLSVGIADLHVSGAQTGEALISAADKALYRVKSMGKDSICAATLAESIHAA